MAKWSITLKGAKLPNQVFGLSKTAFFLVRVSLTGKVKRSFYFFNPLKKKNLSEKLLFTKVLRFVLKAKEP
jgi:hypothetical protein